MSDSAIPWTEEAGLPCSLLSPRVFSDSRALALWCHPNVSSSVAPFSSCPQSCPASGSFAMSWLFASGGQSIRALASVLLMDVKAKVVQSCPTLCDPMDCTVHGILQARVLEWVAFPFSRGSSQPRDWTQVSHVASRFFARWATREALF